MKDYEEFLRAAGDVLQYCENNRDCNSCKCSSACETLCVRLLRKIRESGGNS